MTDNNSDSRTNLQESLKDQHKQGSLHPADLDMLMDSVSGKGYGQKRLNPSEQSSLSKELAEAPEQRSLTGEEENRQVRGHINIVPMVITFALGILVSLLIFRMFSASPQSTKERETITPDAIVEIPDPVLKKAIQDALGIEDGEITGADALSLTKLEYDGYDWEKGESKDAVEDLSGLSAFTNLTELSLPDNQLTEISELSGLTNLTLLWLYNNQISDISALSGLTNLTSLSLDSNQISNISVLVGLTNLTVLYLSDNPISDISVLAELTNLTALSLVYNQISDISALSGLTNLTELNLSQNQLSDISALSGLTNLTELNLYQNQLSDISALSGLTNLTDLDLRCNQLSDISVLSGLTKLTELYLSDNQISDISALSGLTNLETLWLSDNPVLENKSREEIMEVLSGTENSTYIDF